jgi:hypothetical protein
MADDPVTTAAVTFAPSSTTAAASEKFIIRF